MFRSFLDHLQGFSQSNIFNTGRFFTRDCSAGTRQKFCQEFEISGKL